MVKKINTAILISNRGSNMQALIKASQNQDYPAQIVLVISNNPDALGLKFAQDHGIKTLVIDHKKFASRIEFDYQLDNALQNHQVEVVCLAGFMRILSPYLVNKWQEKMINIHPSLLPNFKGANAVLDALNAKAKITGCSTHFVSEEVDCGKIIMQAQVSILPEDNLASLSAKILIQEHLIYPQSLKIVCENLLKKI
ncbi:MAG: phosphoribosylglycinamide formyltransferase [Alphaproteobacteria bacterium]